MTGVPQAPGQRIIQPRPDLRLGKTRRLIHPREFSETYAQGQRWTGRYMVLWLRRSAEASMRVGVVASRKVGGAVARARAKRLLREAFRLNRWMFSGTVDVVLVARHSILTADRESVVGELIGLAEQAGIKPAPRREKSNESNPDRIDKTV